MELILANNSSYPRIGDGSEYQFLRRTIAQWERGEKTAADLRAAEDRMTELALREQIEAGLDLVTDGQIRWYDPISHLAGKLQGVRSNGLLRLFDTNFYFRQPVVQSKPVRMKTLIVEQYLGEGGRFLTNGGKPQVSTLPAAAFLSGCGCQQRQPVRARPSSLFGNLPSPMQRGPVGMSQSAIASLCSVPCHRVSRRS